MSVYTFHKTLAPEQDEQDADFVVENVSNDDTRSLKLLGVQNASVFLSNSTIWVEGITDRIYFRKYLQLYQSKQGVKTFTEDLHYSFVEYSGSNITHWSFLSEGGPVVERLCGKLFLIADGDNATGMKQERYEKLAAKLGSNFFLLKCKEVENLLSPKILIEVLEAYGESAFKQFTQEQYANEPLGAFIESKIIEGSKRRQGSYVEGQTISDKDKFCTRATDAMKSFDDLSPEAQEVTRRIHTFIASNNP